MLNRTNYIYLLKLREFIRTNENIYKIGRTSQNGMKRINQYPKGSELILFRKCINCIYIESEIIKEFKINYKHQSDYGNEYFEGNEMLMIKDINNIIDNELSNKDLVVDISVETDKQYDFSKQIVIDTPITTDKQYDFSNQIVIDTPITTKNKNLVVDTLVDTLIYTPIKTHKQYDFTKQIEIDNYKDLVDLTDYKINITITDKNKKSGYYELKNDYKSYFFGNGMKESLLDVLHNNYDYRSNIGYINIIDNKYMSSDKFHLITDNNKYEYYKLIFYKIDYEKIIDNL